MTINLIKSKVLKLSEQVTKLEDYTKKNGINTKEELITVLNKIDKLRTQAETLIRLTTKLGKD